MDTMKKAIENLIASYDPEAVWIGEMFATQGADCVSGLMARGLSQAEAELSVELFCERILSRVSPRMDPLPFPNYKDELLDELESLVHSYKEAC